MSISAVRGGRFNCSLFFFFLMTTFLTSGCSDLSGLMSQSSKVAVTPKATLSTDSGVSLEYLTVASSGTLTPSGSAVGTTGSGAVTSSGVMAVTGSLAATGGNGASGTGSGSTPSNSVPAAEQIFVDRSVQISIASTLTSGEPASACSFLSPFSLWECLTAGVTLLRSQISTSGNLVARFTDPQSVGGTLESNALPVKRWILEQVTNIYSGGGDTIKSMVAYNGALYFSATFDASGKSKLYKLEGTTLAPFSNTFNNGDDAVDSPFIFNNELYFTAQVATGVLKLFKTNGTTITQVSNTANGSSNTDDPQNLTVFKNALYFVAYDASASNRRKLFRTDGSGVVQVSDIWSGHTDGIYELVVLPDPTNSANDLLFFDAYNASGVTKLFKTDGTTITQVSNLYPLIINFNLPAADSPSNLTVLGSKLYFSSLKSYSNTNVAKLFKTDGVTITQVSNTAGDSVSDSIQRVAVVNGSLYFAADNASGAMKLYSTDGSAVVQVSNTNYLNSTTDDVPKDLKPFNNELYFWGRNVGNYNKLFKVKSDGSTVVQVTDFNVGDGDHLSPGSTPQRKGFFEFKGELYFISYDSSGHERLYKTDGSHVTQVLAIHSNNHDFQSMSAQSCTNAGRAQFAVYGDALYFSAYADLAGCQEKLYRLRLVE